jgi:hypothetical protein
LQVDRRQNLHCPWWPPVWYYYCRQYRSTPAVSQTFAHIVVNKTPSTHPSMLPTQKPNKNTEKDYSGNGLQIEKQSGSRAVEITTQSRTPSRV